MSGTTTQENNQGRQLDQIPAPEQISVRNDQNVATEPVANRSAENQAVDWKKKFKNLERAKKRFQAKINAYINKTNKEMKNLRIENKMLTDKFVNLIGKTAVFGIIFQVFKLIT